jgi:Xaa-Pro aminopeptidase
MLSKARETKDRDEVKRIKKVTEKTQEIFNKVIKFIRNCSLEKNCLIKESGESLRVRDIKGLINLELSRKGLQSSEEPIFSIGRDAGVPHSRGNPSDIIETGKTIVVDISPQEMGGGYFSDISRTFWIGEISERIKQAYRDVKEVQENIIKSLKVEDPAKKFHEMACQMFEEKGHQTVRKDPNTLNGFVHSLGHGVGLEVHEKPSIGMLSTNKLKKGHVFTIEPGLYFPKEGFGIRLEDVIWINNKGKIVNLTDLPKEPQIII